MTKLTYTTKVLPLFTASLGIAAIGAFIGMQYLSFLIRYMLVLYVIEFILLFASVIAKRRHSVGGFLLFAFVFVSGLVISPVISLYLISYGGAIVFQALLLTTVVFGSLSYYAYVRGESFSRLGGFLFAALIGLIITSLINIFLHNPIIFIIVDVVSILVFSGYVLYDTGRILTQYAEEDTYAAVLALYIDFLNLFLDILELLGIFERRRN